MKEEKKSPIVNDDMTVTFNLKNEYSNRVELGGEFRLDREVEGPGTPDSVPIEYLDGVWTYTTEPVLPGIYRYFFSLDGVRALDPSNRWKEISGNFSLVKVEGEEIMPWDVIPNIPHGSIVIEKLHSKTLDQLKRCSIYLPPKYHMTKKKYPVLYLLHGAGGDYNSWVYKGTTDNIMDYLLSKDKVEEIIIVMPDGSILSDKEMKEVLEAAERGDIEVGRRFITSMVSDEHLDYFVKELIPFVESKYRISERKRSVAGLSMGGAQTFNLITSHPELFKTAAMFSSGPAEEAIDRVPFVRDQLQNFNQIYVSCGSWDSIIENTRKFHKALEKYDIKHLYKETDDGGHFWSVWQRNLTEFLPMI
ncbi:MAG: alpha/beta hydrolase [Promethearchaeota archaeon]